MYLPKPKQKRRDLFVNMVTVGSAVGATIPTTFGQTKCNVLIDTGAIKKLYESSLLSTANAPCNQDHT